MIQHIRNQSIGDSSSTSTESSSLLPVDFQPAPYTVIVGRGKEPKENVGNKRLRVLATSFLPSYSTAMDRRTKTRIVSSIVDMVRNSPGGSFVKHAKDGRWYEVNEAVAREKVGYIFRDLLSDKYRSSSKSKVARKHELYQRCHRRLEELSATMASRADMENAIPTATKSFEDVLSAKFHPVVGSSCHYQLEDDLFDMDDLLSAPLIILQ